ncbi:MAG: hypothetical protein GF350_10890 [Chitinivibrionales bacterium]|nr:hypothetical protein [Chitinivibrionales bacterium]
MQTINSQTTPSDIRVRAYRVIKRLVLFLGVILLVKHVLFDSVKVADSLMAPTLIRGDRILVSRLASALPFSFVFNPEINSVAVVKEPFISENLLSYRIAALPGDSIYIDQGVFHNITRPDISYAVSIKPENAVPPEYSPRDYLQPLRLGSRGDTIRLDSLRIRDFTFAASMVRQENPRKNHEIQCRFSLDGAIQSGYRVKDFALYKGPLDSIPQKYHFDYFFWDKLKAYLINTNTGSDVELALFCKQNGKRLVQYTLRQSYIFFLSDNWQRGYDSRYIGPIAESSIKGKAIFVLWSFEPGKPFFKSLRTNRLMKIIR